MKKQKISIESVLAKIEAAHIARGGKKKELGYTQEVADKMTADVSRLLPLERADGTIINAITVQLAKYYDDYDRVNDRGYDGPCVPEGSIDRYETMLQLQTKKGFENLLLSDFDRRNNYNLMDIVTVMLQAMDAPMPPSINLMPNNDAVLEYYKQQQLLEGMSVAVNDTVWTISKVGIINRDQYLAEAPAHSDRFPDHCSPDEKFLTVEVEGKEWFDDTLTTICSEIMPLQDLLHILGMTPYQINHRGKNLISELGNYDFFTRPLCIHSAEIVVAHYKYTLMDAICWLADDYYDGVYTVTDVYYYEERGCVCADIIDVTTNRGQSVPLYELFTYFMFDDESDDTPMEPSTILQIACTEAAYDYYKQNSKYGR